MEEDKRFAHISSDPKFRRVPLRERKVKIDKRFQAMFKDSRFKVKCSVDKRGRPTAIDSRENLRRYYNLSSSDESSSSDDDDEESVDAEEKPAAEEQEPQSTEEKAGPSKDRRKPAKEKQQDDEARKEEASSSEEEDNEGKGDHDIPRAEEAEVAAVSSNVRAKLRDLTVDYARGGGLLNSDQSSSSDEETGSEAEDEEVEHAWGELDKDAETTEESTARLAVCNMDWDRVRSEDLMVLLSSFLPAGGAILKIAVYPSDFGLQSMKEEESMGPKELATRNVAEDDNDSDGEDHFNVERLRGYELRRLRYYYAVVECDSVATGSHIYAECDGLEYESSSAKLDLRFVPDDTQFEHTPRDECSQLPEQNKYRPQFFEASALCKSKFELSWDATDPRRVELSQRVWATKDQEVGDDELKAVLASSSGSESDTEAAQGADKYRALLQGLDEGKGQEKELEVTWGVGLQQQANKKTEENRRAAAGLGDKTPFEELMDRKRQRKKEKRLQREKQRQHQQQEGDGEAAAFSDDDIPEELADLKEQLMESGEAKRANKKKKKSRKQEVEVDPKQKAELELLLMDEAEDEPRHFNLDTRATKSKKKKEKLLQQQDDFKVNVEDARFSALYTSHHFNVDPADKHYRGTPGTQAIVAEKQRRRQREDAEGTKPAGKPAATTEKRPRDAELSMLVRNVKRKTEQNLGSKRKRH